jgi:amidophosphoribosyltransferase
MESVGSKLDGSFACISIITGFGMIAFRDLGGIRPLQLGYDEITGNIYFASETCAIPEGITIIDVLPGQLVYVDGTGALDIFGPCVMKPKTCLFEYIYLANDKSVIDELNVGHFRQELGRLLLPQIKSAPFFDDIDIVAAIPHTPVGAAIAVAEELRMEYVDLLKVVSTSVRNESRTFILPTVDARETAVKHKFAISSDEAKSRCYRRGILLIDDSIVRGTTLRHTIKLIREQVNPRRIYVASLAPAIVSRNVFGIDIPDESNLVTHPLDNDIGKSVASRLNIDGYVIYQSIDNIEEHFQRKFEKSVFMTL